MSYLKQKPGSVEEAITKLSSKVLESDYQDKFKKELEKTGKGIGSMTPDEKKKFFNKIDKMHKAKDEQAKNPYAIGMAAAMKAKDDKPPLKKSTITKAHDIAKSIEKDMKKEEVDIEETHMSTTKAQNQMQKDAKGEKEVVKPIKETILDIWREAAEKKDEKKKDATPPVDNSDEQPKKEEESADKAKAETEKAKDQVQLLKQKIEQEKNKQVQQRVNPETGEPLLQVGVAYKHLKDKMKQEGATAKKEEEEQNKNKKMTDTKEKPSEVDVNPEIKYAN